MAGNPYEPLKQESKPSSGEAFFRRSIEKQNRSARSTARWNGRLLMFIGVPMLALSPFYAKDGKPWQLAITFPLACFFAWCLARWIRWGNQPPKTGHEIAAIAMRRNERIKSWLRGKRNPPPK